MPWKTFKQQLRITNKKSLNLKTLAVATIGNFFKRKITFIVICFLTLIVLSSVIADFDSNKSGVYADSVKGIGLNLLEATLYKQNPCP